MEENELHDILLKNNEPESKGKKIVIGIALVLLIFFIVLGAMKFMSNDTEDQNETSPAPAASTPFPSEPIGEMNGTDENLSHVLQKIKEGANETVSEAPIQNSPSSSVALPVATAAAAGAVAVNASSQPKPIPVATQPQAAKPLPINVERPQQSTVPVQPATPPVKAKVTSAQTSMHDHAQSNEKSPVLKTTTTKPVKHTPAVKKPTKPVQQPVKTPQKAVPVKLPLPTQKSVVGPSNPQGTSQPVKQQTPVTNTGTTGKILIQVGNFAAKPQESFFQSLKGSGFTYVTRETPTGIKVFVGPFSNAQAASQNLPKIRSSINQGAFIVKE